MSLKIGTQEINPLRDYVNKLEIECGECMERTNERINELTKKLEFKEAEIEKLKRRISCSGRQPITQTQIDAILEYRDKGYNYRSIACRAGVSTATVSKYLAKYENN